MFLCLFSGCSELGTGLHSCLTGEMPMELDKFSPQARGEELNPIRLTRPSFRSHQKAHSSTSNSTLNLIHLIPAQLIATPTRHNRQYELRTHQPPPYA